MLEKNFNVFQVPASAVLVATKGTDLQYIVAWRKVRNSGLLTHCTR
jgi:hypothetical protein